MIEDDGWLYLELSDVNEIREHWGLAPIQDAGKIESALARPRQVFGDHTPYPDAASKAAALGWALARVHGLIDGNKRLAAIGLVYFLNANGFDLRITEGELTAIIVQCARGEMEQEEVCLFLRPRIDAAPTVLTDDQLVAMLQPHFDVIHLFVQQAGTEEVVQGGDFWMVLDHIRALIDIAGQLPEGELRDRVRGVVESFMSLPRNFRFTGGTGGDTPQE